MSVSVVGIKDLETVLDAQGIDPTLFEMDVITVPEKGQFVRMKLKPYLGTKEFGKLARKIEETVNGEYMSGPGAHFRVPIKRDNPQRPNIAEPQPSLLRRLEELYDELGEIVKQIREAAS